jgi:hypothetical protein
VNQEAVKAYFLPLFEAQALSSDVDVRLLLGFICGSDLITKR